MNYVFASKTTCNINIKYVLTFSASYCTLFRITSFNINLELFEKYQATKDCIRCKENALKRLKINTGKHELIDSRDAYKDDEWR